MNKPPAQPGMALAEVDTPALVVDLDAFERNLACMQASLAGRGIDFRPHAKTHKSAHIALLQMARGAVGVCCQKVSEAEALADGGVTDILVANEVVGAAKLRRLAALAKRIRVAVCVDDARQAAALEAAMAEVGAEIDVLVEIDVGAGRCGVQTPEAARDLARIVDASTHLRFAGLQAYQGAAQHLRGVDERRAAIAAAVDKARAARAAIRAAGIACDRVTGAGTGTYLIEAASGVYTELQAGSYVFMDVDYARNDQGAGETAPRFEHALFVWATVMSRPSTERAVVDAGLKALSVDSGMPRVADDANVDYLKASDEHGVLRLGSGARGCELGDKILLVPGHCDPTANLHDWYVGVRGLDRGAGSGVVEVVWPISARGAVY